MSHTPNPYCVCGHTEDDHAYAEGGCSYCKCQEFRDAARTFAMLLGDMSDHESIVFPELEEWKKNGKHE